MGNKGSLNDHLLKRKSKEATPTSADALRHPEKRCQQTATKNIEKAALFSLLPVEEIYVADPSRLTIDTVSETFNSFKESVKEKGIIQPILTGEKDEKGFPLFSGSRRLLVCQQLGIKSIPAVIIRITSREEILAIQMIADLIKDDLEPLDEAKLYEKYFMARHPEMKLEDIISLFITYERHPERREDKFAGTVPAIINLSGGKSTSTIKNRLCLLRLPEKIQEAIRNKTISVSLGDIFAGHHDHKDIDEIFRTALNEKKLTKTVLKGLFENTNKSSKGRKPKVFTQCIKVLGKIKGTIESKDNTITENEIDTLLNELEMLRTSLEARKQPEFSTNNAIENGESNERMNL